LVSWQVLESAAPPLAQLGAQRLESARVALLGTLRKDGAPRISPVEPYLSQGRLLFGAMTWSLKTRDLLRDPRCVLHSVIDAPDAGDAEFKLYGRAVEASRAVRDACSAGWWHEQSPDSARVFEIAIEQATLIEWDLERGEMIVRRWSPEHGLTRTSRSYP
jgi:hypothetical protein